MYIKPRKKTIPIYLWGCPQVSSVDDISSYSTYYTIIIIELDNDNDKYKEI